MSKLILSIACIFFLSFPIAAKGMRCKIVGKTRFTPVGFHVYLYSPGTKTLHKKLIVNNNFVFEIDLPAHDNTGRIEISQIYFAKTGNLTMQTLPKIAKKTFEILTEQTINISYNYASNTADVRGQYNDTHFKFIKLESDFTDLAAAEGKAISSMKISPRELNNRRLSIVIFYQKKLFESRLQLSQDLKNKVSLDWLARMARVPFFNGFQKIENVFRIFDKGLQNSKTGQYIEEILNERRIKEIDLLLPGSILPRVVINNLNGERFDSGKLAPGIYFLDFWASWCSPCRAEMPYLRDIFAKYHKKGFNLIAISFDEKKENWMRAIKEENISAFVQLWDEKGWNSEIKKKLGITFIPANFLIDETGRILATNLDHRSLELELKGKLK